MRKPLVGTILLKIAFILAAVSMLGFVPARDAQAHPNSSCFTGPQGVTYTYWNGQYYGAGYAQNSTSGCKAQAEMEIQVYPWGAFGPWQNNPTYSITTWYQSQYIVAAFGFFAHSYHP